MRSDSTNPTSRARSGALSIWIAPSSVDGDAILAVAVEQVDDPLGPIARVPLRTELVRVVRVDRGVVGRDDPAGLGIELARQVVERDQVRPLVPPVGAADRVAAPCPAGSERIGMTPGVLVPDVPVDVGIDEVLRRSAVRPQSASRKSSKSATVMSASTDSSGVVLGPAATSSAAPSAARP